MFSPAFYVSCILLLLSILKETGGFSRYVVIAHSSGSHSSDKANTPSAPPRGSGPTAAAPKRSGLQGPALIGVIIGSVFFVLIIGMIYATSSSSQPTLPNKISI